MPCEPVKLNVGGTAIVCSRGKRKCACGRPATLLCDYPTPEATQRTCNAPICQACALRVAPDRDLCKRHAEQIFRCKFCGCATVTDPSDQSPPLNYCDHSGEFE